MSDLKNVYDLRTFVSMNSVSERINPPYSIKIVHDGKFSLFLQFRHDGPFFQLSTTRRLPKLYKTLTALYADLIKIVPSGLGDVPIYINKTIYDNGGE